MSMTVTPMLVSFGLLTNKEIWDDTIFALWVDCFPFVG